MRLSRCTRRPSKRLVRAEAVTAKQIKEKVRTFLPPKPKPNGASFPAATDKIKEVVSRLKALPTTVGDDETLGSASHPDLMEYLEAIEAAELLLRSYRQQVERVAAGPQAARPCLVKAAASLSVAERMRKMAGGL